jgi:thiosulfate dehydrogenase [quinone] large subunit
LGFATLPDKSWLLGNSPTFGFLKNATIGPFSNIFKNLAGNLMVDWLFMVGLLLIGISLTFGIAIKTASYSGALLMFLMWIAVLPKEHNPILDDHIINLLVLIGIAILKPRKFSLIKNWYEFDLVKKYSILK